MTDVNEMLERFTDDLNVLRKFEQFEAFDKLLVITELIKVMNNLRPVLDKYKYDKIGTDEKERMTIFKKAMLNAIFGNPEGDK